jgi:hypothetical protein
MSYTGTTSQELQMSRRKRITATIKMTYADDSDLIEWWHSIPLGNRNAALKEIIREYIAREGGYYHPREVPVGTVHTPQFDLSQLDQLRSDTAWIRDALQDMPAYLEQLLTHAVSIQAATILPDSRAPTPDAPALDDAESQRRARKLKRVSW